MASCIKSIKISDLLGVKEEKSNRVSSIMVMLALIIFLSLISAIPFIQGETAEESNSIPQEYIRLSELSPATIDKIEGELNKRLLDSKIKPVFFEGSVQGDSVNLLVERNGWKALSLNEKADTLLQVTQRYRATIKDLVRTYVQLNNIKPEIHFYERGSNKELAFWTEGSSIIID